MNREKRMVTMYSASNGSLTSRKQDRNAPCKCKSGKKAKNCCGCETEYFKPKKVLTEDEREAKFKNEL